MRGERRKRRKEQEEQEVEVTDRKLEKQKSTQVS
jgi:hypothetical protein